MANNKRQNLRRKTGDQRRIEVVLVADNERDQYASHFLGKLPRGQITPFVKDAIWEKVCRVDAGLDGLSASDQIEALFKTLADRDRVIDDLFSKLDRMDERLAELQRRPVTLAQTFYPPQSEPPHPPTLPESTETTVSSGGIDMNRPRPRPAARAAAPTPPDEPEELSEYDQIRLAKIFAASIRNATIGGVKRS